MKTADDSHPSSLVSVVVLNYNGKFWLERCLHSLLAQTIASELEIIVVDNASTDDSWHIARDFATRWPQRFRFIGSEVNLGYCAGNNLGAGLASGRYLLFLNNDAWLEADCIEKLVRGVQRAGADAASPTVCDYENDQFQTSGAVGFDLFGQATAPLGFLGRRTIMVPPGCAFLIRRDVFERVGGFDPEFFMYADETDLGWRLALAGFRAITVPEARVHHRGAANANPEGGAKVTASRTNEMVRFYATRNGLLVLLKNAQNLLLLLAITNLVLIFLEAVVVFLIVRRWRPIRSVYLRALWDCWRLRHHIQQERQRIRRLRKCNDFQMLRFFRLKPNLWNTLNRFWKNGFPQIDPYELSVRVDPQKPHSDSKNSLNDASKSKLGLPPRVG